MAAAAGWPDEIRLAVNLSAKEVLAEDLCGVLVEVATREGFALDRLTVEVTEGHSARDASLLISVLEALTQLGVRISLDDFGTGHSSIARAQAGCR